MKTREYIGKNILERRVGAGKERGNVHVHEEACGLEVAMAGGGGGVGVWGTLADA